MALTVLTYKSELSKVDGVAVVDVGRCGASVL